MTIVRDLSDNRPNNAPIADPHYDRDNPTYIFALHLASLAAGATTTPVIVESGVYIFDAKAGAWNGGTVIVEALSVDGSTYNTILSLTANTTSEVHVAQNASIRLRGTVATVSDLSVGAA